MQDPKWWTLSTKDVLQNLDSKPEGLSSKDAQQRLSEHGPNSIPEKKQSTLIVILLKQFSDFMIIVLLLAALISGFIGELADTLAILFIVLLNACIGAVQEYRADRAVAALRKMSAPNALVLRDTAVITVAATELVQGDVIILEAGNIVPADLRLLETEDLQLDESTLTGESQTVAKQSAPLHEPKLAVADRQNLVFKSTFVTRGSGKGIVVGTASDTEIGRIAQLLLGQAITKTPLQLRLIRFGRYLALAVLLVCMLVFISGLLQGQPLLLMFLTAVSLAVAAIPEALPAVVSISLALGARKLILHHALVRNLPAVETLGSVTYICTDKTGTLTQNQMKLEYVYTNAQRHTTLPAEQIDLAQAMALSNDVQFKDGEPAGEPTELALFIGALAAGFDKQVLLQVLPRLAALPFDSQRKLMTTLHRSATGVIAYTKGAPEQVLQLCSETSVQVQAIKAEADSLADQGYRVLAIAKREFTALPDPMKAATVEQELTFLGLVALLDPPREEAQQAVADCIMAGITPVMITGDHPGTALAIAKRLGIADSADKMLIGSELAALSDAQFAKQVSSLRIYARVSPEQKLRIVTALQSQGEFVAMTGDGVNDAPALKRANIGVSMGQKGTDVARSASDMVLLDDNFASIVSAVKTGRQIFDNIRKFIKYTMSSNSGEILTLLMAPLLGLPIPLLPIHILWINLITDGLPGLAYAAEPLEAGTMQRAPRPPQENIFAHGMWQHIVWVGLFVGTISLVVMAWALSRGLAYWQTMVFTVLTLSQLFHALAVRSESASLFKTGLGTNLPMLGAFALTFLLQMLVIYLPMMNNIFHTQALPLFDLMICLLMSSSILFAVEFEKYLVRGGLIYREKSV
jgi:Ca2+-transporting ATPase